MLSDGQSVKELVEDDVSWRSPPSLSAVFFLTSQRSQTISKPFYDLVQGLNETTHTIG